MSRRTFTENIINLAAENCLVCDLPDILTAGMVFKMSEDRLREIASESDEVMAERGRLQDEVTILEKGLHKCRLNKPRTMTGSLAAAFLWRPARSNVVFQSFRTPARAFLLLGRDQPSQVRPSSA